MSGIVRKFAIAPMMEKPTERESVIDSRYLDGDQKLHVVLLVIPFLAYFAA